jgi:hypothetical protein
MRYEWEENMKKVLALFLVFSILALSGNLYAKERKGAELIIHKKDRVAVHGELIAMKKDSLLLKEADSGTDNSMFFAEIREIKIVRKTKAGTGALIGSLALGGLTAIGFLTSDDLWLPAVPGGVAGYIILIGGLGGLIGAGLGAISGADYTYRIEGKTDSELEEIWDKLKKKARVPDFQ